MGRLGFVVSETKARAHTISRLINLRTRGLSWDYRVLCLSGCRCKWQPCRNFCTLSYVFILKVMECRSYANALHVWVLLHVRQIPGAGRTHFNLFSCSSDFMWRHWWSVCISHKTMRRRGVSAWKSDLSMQTLEKQSEIKWYAESLCETLFGDISCISSTTF